MEKKYWRVSAEDLIPGKIYDTDIHCYGQNFKDERYRHFLSVYSKIMSQINLPVDFLIYVNNNICIMGGEYLEVLNRAINLNGDIVLQKVSPRPEYNGFVISLDLLDEFLQSFDEDHPFGFFESGPELWEFFLERVRAKEFSSSPSRLSSTFFFTSYGDANDFTKRNIGSVSEVEITEVKNMQECDMNIIDHIPTTVSRDELYEILRKYWRGEKTDDPVPEIIFQGKYQMKGNE